MSKLNELRDGLAYVEAELRNIHESAGDEPLDDDTQACWDAGTKYVTDTEAQVAAIEAREAQIAAMEQRATARTLGTGAFQYQKPTATDIDVRSASRQEARDAGMKLLERSIIDSKRREAVERAMSLSTQHYDGDFVARSVVLTEDPAYQSAFAKGVTGQAHLMSDNERAAVLKYNEFRAVKGSVDTSGGFGIPIVIDPTIRITSGTGLNGLLQYVTVEPVTTDAWRGVTAAHTTWAEVGEGADGTDDAPTFAQPSIPVVTSRATIPYTIEADQDYPGLATQMMRILDSGYTDHIIQRMVVGAGTTTIKGVFTALDATTGSEVTVTTDALFGAVDIDKVWANLPERWRENSIWLMNVDVENEIRAFGSGTATSRFTVDQTAFGLSLLNGRPVVRSDWAPLFTGTTGAANILAVFDPREYILAQRVGMSVEYVPHLISKTNGLPNGQRAWFAYARAGGDIPVTQAGRVLQNT